jgi:hypothetical protein
VTAPDTLPPAEWMALCDAARGPLKRFNEGYANDEHGPFHGPLVCARLRYQGYFNFIGHFHHARYEITQAGTDYVAARHCGLAEADQ